MVKPKLVNIPQEIWKHLSKESNQTEIILSCLSKFYMSPENMAITNKKELEFNQEEIRRIKEKRKEYKIEFCTQYINEMCGISMEMARIIAEEWIEDQETDCVNINEYLEGRGCPTRDIEKDTNVSAIL